MDPLKKIMEDLKNVAQEEPTNESLEIEATVEAMLHNLSPIDHKQNLIEYYNNCSICGTELEFTHVTHFTHFEVEEEAHCPSCKIRMKKESHGLQ